MKVRRFELITGIISATLGGAILGKGEHVAAGIIALVFSYLWATGFFTNVFYEDGKEGGVRHDRSHNNTRLPVARRKQA